MGERLESWKQIAVYLGREVRTVQRWAQARRLPVHRVPAGGRRSRVFSLKSEIDAWMQADAEQPREQAVSVAVLPFVVLSGDAEDQYFGDGLADDIINALVRIPGLRVTARTSSFACTDRGQDVRQIGARLRAAWLVEGSVQRDRNRNRVRVSAQLVNTRDGYHAWSECFDRELADPFAIQDDIAGAVARSLNLQLGCAPPAERPTTDLVAYDLWVKGRSTSIDFTPAAYAEARQCYESAIARDPTFGRAYFGLADLLFYGVQFGLTSSPDTVARVRQAITRSIELDPTFGEAHAVLGVCRGILDYDWSGAERAFDRAFALSPGSAAVLIEHAWYHLVPRLRIERALSEAQLAIALDPMSPLVLGLASLVRVTAGQYAEAVEESARAVQLAPGLWWLRWFHATALLMRGRLVQGMREARTVYEQVHEPLITGAMALVYGLSLRRKRAQQLLAQLTEMSRTTYTPPVAFALAYIGVGDDRAFEWLHKAIDARDPLVTHLPSMPLYDVIRGDPRFQPLLARMHLA